MDRRVNDILQHRIMREKIKILEHETILAPDLLHVLLIRIDHMSVLVRPCRFFPKIYDLAAIHLLKHRRAPEQR